MKHALLVPYTFLLMNWAAVVSLYYFLARNNDSLTSLWTIPATAHTAIVTIPLIDKSIGEEDRAA